METIVRHVKEQKEVVPIPLVYLFLTVLVWAQACWL